LGGESSEKGIAGTLRVARQVSQQKGTFVARDIQANENDVPLSTSSVSRRPRLDARSLRGPPPGALHPFEATLGPFYSIE
jgi:hypothetical protein